MAILQYLLFIFYYILSFFHKSHGSIRNIPCTYRAYDASGTLLEDYLLEGYRDLDATIGELIQILEVDPRAASIVVGFHKVPDGEMQFVEALLPVRVNTRAIIFNDTGKYLTPSLGSDEYVPFHIDRAGNRVPNFK